MIRGILAAVLVAFALVACDRIGAPADPLADARAACADANGEPQARKIACDTLLASEDGLTEQGRRDALAHRGDANEALNEPTAALADYNAALALDANFAEAKLGRAAILLNSGQLDAVAALLESVGDVLPARSHLLRGQLYARQSDWAAAITEFDAAIEADARSAPPYVGRALAKQALGDFTGAAPDFDTALRLDPSNARAHAGRCWNRVRQAGDLAQALSDAEAASDVTDAQLCRGLIMLRREDWAEARAAYDAVLLKEPANAAALFGRGFARRESGERSEGAADIRRAYDFNSHIDEEFEALGVDF